LQNVLGHFAILEITEKTHYEVLGVPADASHETIKAMYRLHVLPAHYATLLFSDILCQVLREHPDKAGTGDGESFYRIRRAWEVLQDPLRRKEYDNYLACMCFVLFVLFLSIELIVIEDARHQDGVVITAEVDISEFECTEGPDEVRFSYPCRCGGTYVATQNKLFAGIDVVPCEGCSLYVRVLYDLEEE